ncbi:MAG: glycosyltransferase family 4 protein [Leadbetterella sp.]|nr:glycosyltransferase family 4 protein [Leadbetterella sp.]
MKKVLFVTFPFDLGGRTIENNFNKVFKQDFEFYRFSEKHYDLIGLKKMDKFADYVTRIKSIFTLRAKVKAAIKEEKTILFYGVFTAIASIFLWNNRNSAITFDWNRSLKDYTLGNKIKKDFGFYIHKFILHRFTKILVCSDFLKQNLIEVFKIEERFIYKVLAPFDVNSLNIIPRESKKPLKVLFVGGEIKRKGADEIIKYFNNGRLKGINLTMVTNDRVADINGINFRPNIKFGTSEHSEIFAQSDILLLPTRFDSYPMILGEAASAGLLIFTTSNALIASEVTENNVNGFILSNPVDCIEKMLEVIEAQISIDDLKHKSYESFCEKYSYENVRESYINVLNK